MVLPVHGRIDCAVCHGISTGIFDRTRTEKDGWRITNNPLAWGGSDPEIIVLGFSKGPTQAGALSTAQHDAIAYKGGRSAVAKILHHLGLIDRADSKIVDHLISDRSGRFHFGSLVRCTVERYDTKSEAWTGTGGGMLDKFVQSELGNLATRNCGSNFLGSLPPATRLVLMMGMGAGGNYIKSCRSLFGKIRPGNWRSVNDVAYADDDIVVVHSEHFASQGALLPNWLSGNAHERGRLGLLAKEAVAYALER